MRKHVYQCILSGCARACRALGLKSGQGPDCDPPSNPPYLSPPTHTSNHQRFPAARSLMHQLAVHATSPSPSFSQPPPHFGRGGGREDAAVRREGQTAVRSAMPCTPSRPIPPSTIANSPRTSQ